MRKREFREGIKAGIPVCLGYFSVSFGFGAMAVAQGLSLWEAVLISASNLTSAGQFAGLTVITAGAAIIELILTQLVINSRYALMGLALGQRLGPSVGTLPRLAMAFFDTDEVFALGMARPGRLTARFFLGAGLIAALGWTMGTACGALAGMGLALVFSCLFTWLPGLKEVSGGLAIVLCTVAAAAICALLFPIKEES